MLGLNVAYASLKVVLDHLGDRGKPFLVGDDVVPPGEFVGLDVMNSGDFFNVYS